MALVQVYLTFNKQYYSVLIHFHTYEEIAWERADKYNPVETELKLTTWGYLLGYYEHWYCIVIDTAGAQSDTIIQGVSDSHLHNNLD